MNGPRLGVNVDHVATLRQARRAAYPDPVAAALLAELAGADQITIHLREDRRHIQDRDLQVMRRTVTTRLNLEMAATAEMVKIAHELRPDQVTLVPERREELTTEGGLDVVRGRDAVSRVVDAAKAASKLGLQVAAGHGLHYQNVQPVVAIREIEELNIGHAIVARAVLVGMERAVREMKEILRRGDA